MGTLKAGQVWLPGSPSSVTLVQRLQSGNRSPLESPPVAKKPLKTASKLEFLRAPAVVGKENRSILKSPRLGAVIGGANELGGASMGGARTRSWPGSLRRVNFEHNVDVVVYDPVDGDYVCSESQLLNTEPRDRKFIRRASRVALTTDPAIGSSHQPLDRLQPQTPAPHRPLPPGPHTSPPSTSASSGTLERNQSPLEPQQQDLDFTFFEDHRGQLRLKFTVPLGPGVAAGDALVKANVTGNKIRVLGTRTVTSPTEDGAGRRQDISCRYSLPMDVDPYAITARMDSCGNLFVEAPVITGDRRRTLAATEQIGRMIASQ